VPAGLGIPELGGEREPADGLGLAELERFGATQPGDGLDEVFLSAAALAELLLSGRVDAGVLKRERGEAGEAGQQRDVLLPAAPLPRGSWKPTQDENTPVPTCISSADPSASARYR
jgi:hypothetical protein